ncbi:MAG: hypothetical protein Q9223_000643 [Gallowayella weberi]
MDAGNVKQHGPALADLTKDIGNLTIDDSSGETRTQKPKKRKNHRGGQKKKQKSGQASTGAGAGSSKANESADNDNDSEPLYEVKETANKGLGVFATRDIPRGTRIMCDCPLIHVDHLAKPFVPTLVRKLPAEDQAKFTSLFGYWPPGQKAEAERDFRRLSLNDTKLVSMEDQLKIIAVFRYNGHRTDSGVAVCYHVGRLNHSCLPNAYHTWNNVIDRATVHAVQDIAKGEEILTTYLPAALPRAQRQSQLLERWGFRCQCPACDSSSAFGKASDRRRKRLQELNQLTESYNKQLANPRVKAHHAKALAVAIERVELLLEEGIHDMDLKEA